MSVKEKYDVMIAEKQATEEAARQAEEAKRIEVEQLRMEAYTRWREREAAEGPQIFKKLTLKCFKLRSLGIIGMVEDFVDANIEYLYVPEPQTKYSHSELAQRKARRERSFSRVLNSFSRGGSWNVRTKTPELDRQTLIWENADRVNLVISREFKSRFNGRDSVVKTEYVDLAYDSTILTIRGDKEEFGGRIPARKVERIEVVESALARAFFDPRVVTPNREHRSHLQEFEATHHIPIVIGA